MSSTECVLYFAYGSNMLTPRLRDRNRAPSAQPVATGHLPRHRLTFDKVGRDESGKCSIAPTDDPTDRVYGVVFRMTWDHLESLDAAEGLGTGYRRTRVDVVSGSRIHRSDTYIALRTEPVIQPFDWYRDLVAAGAEEHGLPAAYVAAIRAVPCLPDTSRDRQSRASTLLANRPNLTTR